MKHSKFLVKAVLIGTFGISSLLSMQAIAQVRKQAGYYLMHLGDAEVVALSDGTVPQDFSKLLTNVSPKEVSDQLTKHYETEPVELSVNSYLIKVDGKLILVDAGTAGAYGPTLGHLTENLKRVGYEPEQIDAVLLTHIHLDHTGGLMDGDKLAFPNATIYASKAEVEFWFGEKSKKEAPESLKNYFSQAEATVGPYLKAGKVKTFSYGNELFPGITPIAAPGHTPGHTFYALESKGQKLLFWGDIMHAAEVQFRDPSVTIVYDVDTKIAAAQRKRAFADAAKNGYLVAGDHLSFPGIGRLRTEGSSYIWLPVNYSTYPGF